MNRTAGPRPSRSLVPRNGYLAAIAAAALALSLLEIADAFEPPFESALAGTVSSGALFSAGILASLQNLGYLALFVLMLLESASFPLPSELILPFTGYMVYTGYMSFTGALVVSTAAGLAGALVDYYVALRFGRPYVNRLLRLLGVRPEQEARAEGWINSRGSVSVLLARFVPGLRSVISIPAGLLRMRLKPFVAMTVLGSLGWSLVLIYLGYSAGPLWDSVLGSASSLVSHAAAFVVAGVSACYIGYYILPVARRDGATITPPPSLPHRRAPDVLTLSYWSRFIKFNIVGLSGVAINEGLLVLLTTGGVYYLYSSAVAIEASILSNFLLHDVWTFGDRRSGHMLGRLAKFNALMLAGLATNLLVIYLGTDFLAINYALSNLAGIGIAFLLRYVLSVRYTWIRGTESRREERSGEAPGSQG